MNNTFTNSYNDKHNIIELNKKNKKIRQFIVEFKNNLTFLNGEQQRIKIIVQKEIESIQSINKDFIDMITLYKKIINFSNKK